MAGGEYSSGGSSRIGPRRLRLDVALALASVANRAYSVALVVYVYNATHSSAWVAAAAAARYLPGIVTSVFAVRILDRFPPRRLLVLSDICCAIAIAAMAAAMFANAPSAVAIALAAVVRIAASGQAPAAALLLPIVAGGGDLSRVASRQATTDKLLLLAGPAVGGLLLIVISAAVEMLVLAVLVTVAAVVSLGLPSPGQVRPLTPDPAIGGRRKMRANTTSGISIFVALMGLSGLVYGTDTVLLAVLATTRLHLGDAGYGELFAGLGTGGVLAAPVVNRIVRQHRLAGWLLLCMVVYCVPSVLIAHSHNAGAVVALEALRGAGALAVDVVALTELQRFVLPQGLPLLTARLTSVVFGAVAIGALATPLCLHAFGTTGTLTLLGVVPPIVVIGVYPVLRRSDTASTSRFEELEPRIVVLQHLGLLQATSRPVLERLAADISELGISAGTTIIREHDVADAFYVVRAGELEVFVGDRHVNDLHPGDWFGEIGLLEGVPRTATVITVVPSVIYRIGGEAFLEAFAQLPPSPSLLDSVAARLAVSRLDAAASAQN
ncbi:MAG TPA: cyclic nucleotide-binding domain-containing protein [Acidothermaceae bacterium]